MKISIKLEHKNKVYISEENEVDQDDFQKSIELIERACSGDLDIISFKNGNEEYYFGKKILEQSIITIINTK